MKEVRSLPTGRDADGAAVLDTRAGTITTMNATGAYIWEALQRGESVDSIADSLHRETGHPLAEIQADIQSFLRQLEQHALVGN